jgi:hypothetical protein
MKYLITLTLAALALSACGGSSEAEPTTVPAPASVTTEPTIPETTIPETTIPETTIPETTIPETTEYVLTDEEPPPFVLLGADPQDIKGYVMPNGRIMWLDETSGIGRIIANPDEVLADQATCEYLFGMDTADWFDWANGIPNFNGPVCHPYSVNEGL